MNWVEGLRTANLFGRQTKRNGLNGLMPTFRTTLRMSCGQMKRPYSSSAIRDSAAGGKANDPAQNLVPSIQSRCICGLELDDMEPPKSVLLMV